MPIKPKEWKFKSKAFPAEFLLLKKQSWQMKLKSDSSIMKMNRRNLMSWCLYKSTGEKTRGMACSWQGHFSTLNFSSLSHYSTRIGITDGKNQNSEGSGDRHCHDAKRQWTHAVGKSLAMTVFKSAEETTNYCVKYLPELISYYLK